MTMGLTLPIIVGLGAGVKAFASFDKAMTESLAIMGNVSDNTRSQMSALASQLSGESTFAAKELAESYYFLASAGLDAEKSMAALPVVMKFAQAGAFNMAQATDLLTDAYSALGPAIQKTGDLVTDMTSLSDILVKANTLANASVQQFSEALTSEAAAAMRNFGVEVEDGVAVLAAYADQGLKGAAAGSQFGRALRLLVKAQAENSEEFRQMGIKIFNSSGELRDFAEITGDMEKAFKGMSTEAKTAGLKQLGFQARTQQAILPLIGASEKIRKYKEGLKEAGDITEEVANKQLKTFANQMTLLKNRVVNAFRSLGETLVPAITAIAKQVGDLTAKFQALSPTTKKVVAYVLLFVAALGPLLLIIGKTISLVGSMPKQVRVLGKALLWLNANPMVLIIAAAIAGAAAIAKLTSVIFDWIKASREAKSVDEWLKSQVPIEVLKAQTAAMWKKMEAEEALAKIAGMRTQVRAQSTFKTNQGDRDAQAEYGQTLADAVYDQMTTEQKINKLLEDRAKLTDTIADAQTGSKAWFDSMKKAVTTEAELRGLVQARAGEISSQKKEQPSQFASAIEAGSVEDYKLRIRSSGRDNPVEIQKKQEKELVKLNKQMAESITILRQGFEVATGQDLVEVTIL